MLTGASGWLEGPCTMQTGESLYSWKDSFQFVQNWLLVAYRLKGGNQVLVLSIPYQGLPLTICHLLTYLKRFLPNVATAHQCLPFSPLLGD